MNSLPTCEYDFNADYEAHVKSQYDVEAENNNALAEKLFESIFPNARNSNYPFIYKIVTFLEETDVDPQVLPWVIKGISNINSGSKKGEVIINVMEDKYSIAVKEKLAEVQFREIYIDDTEKIAQQKSIEFDKWKKKQTVVKIE